MGDPTVEVVASGLDVPWSMAFAPDGRLFVAERPGRIRVIDETGLLDDPWASIDVARVPGSEAGLMGLAIDPDFGNTGHVFACYSFLAPPDRILNRVVRFREVDGRGVDEEVLVDDIPGGRYHNGCRLGFGPDGMLYATTGDATEEDLAQDPGSLAGKVLRMSTDGSVPADNPFEGSLVWSLGHRNSQGIAWRPSTGALWSTEHGTTGYNEVNHIVRGGNYGWPFIRVGEQDDRFVEPAVGMNEIPPAGAAFISGGRYDGMDDRLVFTVLGSGGLQVAMIVGNEEVAGHGELIDDRFGRLRDVVLGPDGYLYISTSNRDQLGDPGPDDDRILRIISF
jgi:glucose/arabinose dehydrogenase